MILKISIKGNAARNVAKLSGELQKGARAAVIEATAWKKRKTLQQFASQTDPDGAAWAPPRPSTLRQKRTSSILTETGAMKASITGRSNGLAGTISIGQSYARFHQTGTRKMAQRRILGWAGLDQAPILKIFESHIPL